MAASRWMGMVLVSVVSVSSGMLGWYAGAQQARKDASPPAAALPAARQTLPNPTPSLFAYPAARPVSRTDSVVLDADGNVSLQVEQRPLSWLLAELKRQGWDPAASCTVASQPTPEADEGRLVAALNQGTEDARHEALLQARSLGVFIPDTLLRQLMESGPSDRIRLLAFEQFLESRSGTVQSLRDALQLAAAVPNATVQAEAHRQLLMLTQEQRRSEVIDQRPQ